MVIINRVVITGIGPVTSIGIGKEDFFNNVMNHRTNIQMIPERYMEKYNFNSKFYTPKPYIKLNDYIHTKHETLMEEISKISVLGAFLALKDAKIFNYEYLKDGEIIIGLSMSSLQTALDSYASHVSNNSTRYNRMVIPMLMPNSPAAWISILFGIKGPSYTINASCASGTYAIGQAYEHIKNGKVKIAITGGVESLGERYGAIMRGFDMLSTLTRSINGEPMPFSTQRSGFLFNEGAGCILVLEDLNAALKRGANIYAEILDYASCSDAYNILQIEDSGKQIISMLKQIIGTNKIDYLNSHGTGTKLNDETESEIIKKVFGNKNAQPYINSTKGILGHSIGASGAIETAITAMSIKYNKIHNNKIKDPIENLNLVIDKSIDTEVNHAITTSYGFGGHNASILLKKI